MTPAAGRIPSLDGLRAIAIVLVLVGHGANTVPAGWLEPHAPATRLIHRLGETGVQVFFVLSGYLITRLLLRERETYGRIGLGKFYLRRALRILPAFYAYLAVVAVLCAVGAIFVAPGEFLPAALFLENIRFHRMPTEQFWYVGHLWSLSVEEQFYLFWPLVVCVGSRRSLVWACVALFALCPLLKVAFYAANPTEVRNWHNFIPFSADRLMFGCLFAVVEGTPRGERLARLLSHPLAPLLAALFLLLGTLLLEERYDRAYRYTARTMLDGLATLAVMVWCQRHPAGPVGRVLNSRPVSHVGVLSYSLYLWQQLFLVMPTMPLLVPFPWNFAAVAAAAECSYWLVERPLMNLRKYAQPKPVAA